MSRKPIVVETIPLQTDKSGNVSSGNLEGAIFEMTTITVPDPITGEEQTISTLAPKKMGAVIQTLKNPEDDAQIKIASMTPVEGSVLKFRLQDGPYKTAPDKLPCGEFTLLKGYDFQLEWSDKPIAFDTTGIPDNLEYNNKTYSPFPTGRFKTQKSLFFYLINRRSFFSDFIWHKLEHPPEHQKKLTLHSLMERKRLMLEEQQRIEKENQKTLKKIEKELRDLGMYSSGSSAPKITQELDNTDEKS